MGEAPHRSDETTRKLMTAILLELKKLGYTLKPSMGKEWVVGDIAVAPSATQSLVTYNGTPSKQILIHGYVIAAEEANSFKLTYATSKKSYELLIPTTSAGIIVVISEDIALNEGLAATGNVNIAPINAATAGTNYQAMMLIAEADQ